MDRVEHQYWALIFFLVSAISLIAIHIDNRWAVMNVCAVVWAFKTTADSLESRSI